MGLALDSEISSESFKLAIHVYLLATLLHVARPRLAFCMAISSGIPSSHDLYKIGTRYINHDDLSRGTAYPEFTSLWLFGTSAPLLFLLTVLDLFCAYRVTTLLVSHTLPTLTIV